MSDDNDIKSKAPSVSFIVLEDEGHSIEHPLASSVALKSLAGGSSNTGGSRLFIGALFCS